MSAWTTDMASALPNAPPADGGEVPAEAPISTTESTTKTPQELGWAAKINYDYASYNMSSKQLQEAQTDADTEEPEIAVGGLATGQWHSNAAVYHWNDEYGDVGPKFKELEKQLFGAVNHVRSGMNFSA
jgi:ATP-dependent RNA helicase DDX3X